MLIVAYLTIQIKFLTNNSSLLLNSVGFVKLSAVVIDELRFQSANFWAQHMSCEMPFKHKFTRKPVERRTRRDLAQKCKFFN